MNTHNASSWLTRLRWALPVMALGSWLLAWIGYSQYLVGTSWSDDAFYATNLVVLNYYSTGSTPPVSLNIARFLVHVVAGGALALGVLAFLQARRDRRAGNVMRGHTVVLGASDLAQRLAASYLARGPVLSVGVADAGSTAMLRRAGVRVVDTGGDAELRSGLAGAARVIVTADDDSEVVRLLARVNRLGDVGDAAIIVVVEDPALATELRLSVAQSDNVDICCTAERLAGELLRRYPPRRDDEIAPPPIVIGAGPLPQEVARRIVYGWERPADPQTVLCIGPDTSWAADLQDEVGRRGTLVAPAINWSPRAAARLVEAHVASWQPTPDAAERRTVSGPLVIAAGLDDAAIFTATARIAAVVPRATVVAVVEDADGWQEFHATRRAAGTTFAVIAVKTLLAEPDVLEANSTALLAIELFSDALRRPGMPSAMVDLGVPPIAGEATFEDLATAARQRYLDLARAIPGALEAGGLVLGSDGGEPVLQPDEINALAGVLTVSLSVAAARGAQDGHDRYALCGFCAVLPALAARAGVLATRPDSAQPLLTAADIEVMARNVHAAYQRAQGAVNATGSTVFEQAWDDLTDFAKESNRAQARDIPVKVAAAGLRLRRRGDSAAAGAGAPPPAPTDWLTPDLLERLGQWEHWRWTYVHRLAGYRYAPHTNHGAREHSMLVSWHELTDGQQDLDRQTVRLIPEHLALVGLEVGERPSGLR